MKKNINVLSLFDGIATGLVALKELGYTPNYYASEIEEGAISVAMKNHPEIIQMGDVTKLTYKDGNLYSKDYVESMGKEITFQKRIIGKIDLLIGGSPCQNLSQQHSTREGLQGEKSSLFYHYIRLLKEVNPKYFLLENVIMKKYDQEEITNFLGVKPIRINSKLVSAQMRDRLYWTNIPDIDSPEDRHILLSDIIEYGYSDREKSNCITEGTSRHAATPRGVRRYMMAMGQMVFDNKEEYERIVGTTKEDRLKYCKDMRALKDTRNLKEGIDTPKARLLTPNEVETLQTLPKDYTYVEELYYSSKGYNKNRGDIKRISMLGEGWTKDVIVHIMKNMEFEDISEIIKHKIDGKEYSVQSHLIGKRSGHSLCWQDCKKFKPNNVINCKIAQELSEFAMINGVKTAVWECTSYEKKEII